MDDQRVGLRVLQDRVAPSGQVIGRLGIGERKRVGRVEVVFVLLPAGYVGIGEAVVEPHPAGARNVRQDAVKHLASAGIGVEPAIDEVAQTASGLRPPPCVGLLD